MARSGCAMKFVPVLLGGGVLLSGVADAMGQAAQRAAFVANNGNLEGSVTSFTFGPGGEPVFVMRYVTGTAPSTSTPNAGTNAYAISLSPNGRWLATSHATASTTVERVELFSVGTDASLTHLGTFDTPDSPLDCEWVRDDLLAVTRTKTSGTNNVIMYRFTPPGPGPATLTQIDIEDAGTFTAYLTAHPNGQLLYAGDSGTNTIWVFRVNPDGTLDPVGGEPTGGIYPLGPGINRAGTRLYAGGGASSQSNKILGYNLVLPSGMPAAIPGSPFLSPGSSPAPKLVVSSSDDAYVFVGHGSSAEIRSFAADPMTGALTNTGFAFDVGIQGELGDAAVLGDLLLVTDNFLGPTGLYAFTIQPNGSFVQNGPLVSTQGIAPRTIAVWDPPAGCYADCNGDGLLNLADFGCFQTKFATGQPYADCNGDTLLNLADFGCFQTKFAVGCP